MSDCTISVTPSTPYLRLSKREQYRRKLRRRLTSVWEGPMLRSSSDGRRQGAERSSLYPDEPGAGYVHCLAGGTNLRGVLLLVRTPSGRVRPDPYSRLRLVWGRRRGSDGPSAGVDPRSHRLRRDRQQASHQDVRP